MNEQMKNDITNIINQIINDYHEMKDNNATVIELGKQSSEEAILYMKEIFVEDPDDEITKEIIEIIKEKVDEREKQKEVFVILYLTVVAYGNEGVIYDINKRKYAKDTFKELNEQMGGKRKTKNSKKSKKMKGGKSKKSKSKKSRKNKNKKNKTRKMKGGKSKKSKTNKSKSKK